MAKVGIRCVFEYHPYGEYYFAFYFCLQHLWKLVVEESRLVGQLITLKDFFLLGRGELFLAFIDHAQNLLKNPAHSHLQNMVSLGRLKEVQLLVITRLSS